MHNSEIVQRLVERKEKGEFLPGLVRASLVFDQSTEKIVAQFESALRQKRNNKLATCGGLTKGEKSFVNEFRNHFIGE